MNLPGPNFERNAPLHDWRHWGTRNGYKTYRCEKCARYMFIAVGMRRRENVPGHCGVPGLGGSWRVGERNGFVVKVDRLTGLFTLRTPDGLETDHLIGTPDGNAQADA